MSRLMLAGKRLIAGDVVNHGSDFALSKPTKGERGYVRPTNPRRLKFWPVGNEQQHPKGSNPVHCSAKSLQARGSVL